MSILPSVLICLPEKGDHRGPSCTLTLRSVPRSGVKVPREMMASVCASGKTLAEHSREDILARAHKQRTSNSKTLLSDRQRATSVLQRGNRCIPECAEWSNGYGPSMSVAMSFTTILVRAPSSIRTCSPRPS